MPDKTAKAVVAALASVCLITLAVVLAMRTQGRAELAAAGSAEDMKLSMFNATSAIERPQIDLEVPAQLETATFALG